MPFTLSHAAAVLPLATGRPARVLVPAALVIGSWVPDLPYFIPFLHGADWSHSASGPVTIDLVMGLTVFLGWQLVLRRPLVDLAPRWVGTRVPEISGLTVRRLLWAVVSIVLGAVTHVVWDTFSHGDRWGTRHVPWLNLPVGPLPAYKWFQFASGAIGLAVVGVWLVGYLRRTMPESRPSRWTGGQRTAAWLVVTACFLSTLIILWRGAGAGHSLEAVAFGAVTGSIGVAMAAALPVCLVWQVRRRLAP